MSKIAISKIILVCLRLQNTSNKKKENEDIETGDQQAVLDLFFNNKIFTCVVDVDWLYVASIQLYNAPVGLLYMYSASTVILPVEIAFLRKNGNYFVLLIRV